MRNLKYRSLVWVAMLFAVYSCSNIKYLPKGEQLFIGSNVKIDPKETVKRKAIKGELEDLARPKPNSSILGLRPKLWFYNIAGEDAKKGIRKWLRNKIGEPPVLLSQVDPYLIRDLMKSRLDNMGYFKSRVKHEVNSKKRKAEILYTATVSKPYTFNNITYPKPGDSLNKA
ncbi:MAG: hypothetical protein ACM3ME_01880, partial [Chloroflexota bacterium]